jgi:hypothetical protein
VDTLKVRFVAQDYAGVPYSNITVTATPLESSGPWSWLLSLFGISGDTDINGTVLTGTTGSDGAIVFTMVQSVKYRVQFTDLTRGIDASIDIYPQEDAVVISLWPATTPAQSQVVTYELTADAIDDDNTRLRLRYADAARNTTEIVFYVYDDERALVHTESSSSQNTTLTYNLANNPGHTYYFGFYAEHSRYGNITLDKFISFGGDRPRVDLADWIPLYAYNWAAVCIIVCVAAVFGYLSRSFGFVIVPVFGLIFTYMEWLQNPLEITIGALVLGVIIYLREREGETGL